MLSILVLSLENQEGRKLSSPQQFLISKQKKIYSGCHMRMSKESTTCDVLPDFSHLSVPTVDHMAADVNYSVSEVMVLVLTWILIFNQTVTS